MNILVIATRDPGGRTMGRKVVLKTILSCLESLGHVVTLVIVSPPRASRKGARTLNGNVVNLASPGLARMLYNIIVHFSRQSLSLNECAYYSPGTLEAIRRIARERACDLVVADMIRTAPYAASLKLPWVLDLDDLLSRRYEELAGQRKPAEMILGYYGDYLPKTLRGLASRIVNLLLRKESLIIANRELTVSRAADAVCLVAEDEVHQLAKRIDRPVFWMPMAIPVPPLDSSDRVKARPMSMVFTGGLDYQPNLEAIRFYLREIAPAMEAARVSAGALTVIGHCPESVRKELTTDKLLLLGYVDDLFSEMTKHQLFLAPIISGTGIKTKVLEAMALGLPVLSTSEGVKGMKVTNGGECYVAGSPEEFARMLGHIVARPDEALRVGLAARQYVQSNFSFDRMREKWRDVLGSALTAFEESSKLQKR